MKSGYFYHRYVNLSILFFYNLIYNGTSEKKFQCIEYGKVDNVAKKLGKFLVSCAAIGAAAAGVYYYLNKRDEDLQNDTDFDDFDEFEDEDLDEAEDRDYVDLSVSDAEKEEKEDTEASASDAAEATEEAPVKETPWAAAEKEEKEEEFFNDEEKA